jgi:hypothetical protein
LTTLPDHVDRDVDGDDACDQRKGVRDREPWPDDEQEEQRQRRARAVRQQPFGKAVDECRSLEELSWARRMHSYGVGGEHVG